MHAGANENDNLLKTGMPNGGRLQVWPAVGLSRQTQHADSSYGIQRCGIVEREQAIAAAQLWGDKDN